MARSKTPAAASKLAVHQLVKTTQAVRTQWIDVPAGAVGIVVEAYPRRATYAIEFQDHPGVVVTVARSALEPTEWGEQRIPVAPRRRKAR